MSNPKILEDLFHSIQQIYRTIEAQISLDIILRALSNYYVIFWIIKIITTFKIYNRKMNWTTFTYILLIYLTIFINADHGTIPAATENI